MNLHFLGSPRALSPAPRHHGKELSTSVPILMLFRFSQKPSMFNLSVYLIPLPSSYQPQSSPVSETTTPCSHASTAERLTIYQSSNPKPIPNLASSSRTRPEYPPKPNHSTQTCCSAACARSREALASQPSRRRRVETPASRTISNPKPRRRSKLDTAVNRLMK